MNPKVSISIAVILGIIIVIGVIVTGDFVFGPRIDENTIFHVTLADPDLYQDGVYSSSFSIEPGRYEFRFIPNGDSPKKLTITLVGENFSYLEDFELEGTKIETGISEYYIWDYLGKKEVVISEPNELEIKINPHGNLLGAVSVDLIL